MKPKHIFISTGEASGDLIASKLIKALLAKDSDLEITAMGSSHVKNAGATLLLDSNQIAVMGFLEVLFHFKKIHRAFYQVKNFLKTNKPDLLILVDYPGFNLSLAKAAKKMGIKILFYVSPQIWAWKYGRIKKIKKYVDHMAVLFPFEEKIYQKEQVPVTFVGHPLMELNTIHLSKQQIYSDLNIKPDATLIGIFPGSRQQEIQKLMPVFMETVKLIKQRIPNCQFILPLASNLSIKDVEPYLLPEIQIVQNKMQECLAICDAAIAASGTVTLEIALQQIPLIIAYKVSLFTAVVVFFVLKTKWVGLCNIVAQQEIAKELLQYQAKPQKIAAELLKILTDDHYRQSKMRMLKDLCNQFQGRNAPERAAEVALSLLATHHQPPLTRSNVNENSMCHS